MSHGCIGKRFTDAELIIDFNALDTVSVAFDESDSNFMKGDYTGFSKEKFHRYSSIKMNEAKEETKCNMNSRTNKVNFSSSANKSPEVAIDDDTAATVASSTSFMTLPTTKKRVRFGSLTIRENVVELGGSGVPGCGPAITVGWEQESDVTIPSVEDYEEARPCSPRRGIEMLLPKKQRVNLLLESGYTLNQVRQCTQECDDVRRQRARTIQQLSFSDRIKSTLKKLVVLKKSRKT